MNAVAFRISFSGAAMYVFESLLYQYIFFSHRNELSPHSVLSSKLYWKQETACEVNSYTTRARNDTIQTDTLCGPSNRARKA
jgi:hypothetical protein